MCRKLTVQRILSVLSALALWQLAAWLLGQRILLVSPVEVALRLGELIVTANFWRTVFFSLSRIAAGFLLGFAVGGLFAAFAYRFSLAEALLWPYITLAKSVPVVSFIIICLVWLSARDLPIFIVFLMVSPVVYFNLLQGLRATDEKKLQMVRLFRVPLLRRVRYLYLPQLRPFLFSACSVALGMAWKSGVAAEVIGIPTGSIGEQLYEAKVYLSTPDLFAWTVAILLLSVMFEKLFLFLLKAAFERSERR